MKKLLAVVIAGVLLFSYVRCMALTKYESESADAGSVVIYGYCGTTLVPLNVSAAGSVRDFTQNNTGIYWNITNDTGVTKTAASVTTKWQNGTTNNASFAIGIMDENVWTERINITGANTVKVLNTTTFIPSADGTMSLNWGNSTGAVKMTLDTKNGRLGIGTTTPLEGLTIEGTSGDIFRLSRTATSVGAWEFDLASAVGGGAGTIVLRPSVVTGDFLITNSTSVPALFVDTTPGNVGIGTTAPGERLDIAGNGSRIRMRSLDGVAWNCSVANTTGVWSCSTS